MTLHTDILAIAAASGYANVSFPLTPALPMNPEEHPTSNIQRRTSNGSGNPRSLRRSKFDVGCSMFSLGSGESLQFQNWQRIGTMNQIGTPLPALSPQGGEGGRRPGEGRFMERERVRCPANGTTIETTK
ncbi:MAG: hypothetical protein DME22_19145 [Verrucomicrobia bacterium]|nr:MAG: hypothetical protein DME22_19145 [Verrucomicrobiota bacterium]